MFEKLSTIENQKKAIIKQLQSIVSKRKYDNQEKERTERDTREKDPDTENMTKQGTRIFHTEKVRLFIFYKI